MNYAQIVIIAILDLIWAGISIYDVEVSAKSDKDWNFSTYMFISCHFAVLLIILSNIIGI